MATLRSQQLLTAQGLICSIRAQGLATIIPTEAVSISIRCLRRKEHPSGALMRSILERERSGRDAQERTRLPRSRGVASAPTRSTTTESARFGAWPIARQSVQGRSIGRCAHTKQIW